MLLNNYGFYDVCSRLTEYQTFVGRINTEDERLPLNLLQRNWNRTRSLMRQRELLLEHSKVSRFLHIIYDQLCSLGIITGYSVCSIVGRLFIDKIVCRSMPSGSSPVLSCPLYMLWLELLSYRMPPTLFVRGNGSQVLTFYS